MLMIVLYIVLTALFLITLLTLIEIAVYASMKPARELPSEDEKDYYYGKVNGKSFEELYSFLSGEKDAPSFSPDEIYLILKKRNGPSIKLLNIWVASIFLYPMQVYHT